MFSIPLFIEYKSKVTLTIRCKFAFDTIFIVFSGFHIYIQWFIYVFPLFAGPNETVIVFLKR